MLFVAALDTQLFDISTCKSTEKNLNNLQKQETYNTNNSECASTHPIEKAK